MRKLIKVTQKHIYQALKSAKYGDSPIDHAVGARVYAFLRKDIIEIKTPINYNTYKVQEYHQPRSVRRFLTKYYYNKPVKPFNFYLQEKQK